MFSFPAEDAYLLVEFVGEGVGHHGLASAWGPVEQHHHASTVRDDIIQTHLLTTAFVHLKVTHCQENQVLLLFGEDNLWEVCGRRVEKV